MTVSTEKNKEAFAVYSGAAAYQWTNFIINDDADVEAYAVFPSDPLDAAATAGKGTRLLLTLTTDFTVASVPTGGGSITITSGGNTSIRAHADWVSNATTRIAIYRRIDEITQLSEYNNQGAFLSATLEASFDDIYFILQQHEERLGRTLQLDPWDTVLDAMTEADQIAAVRLNNLPATASAVYWDGTTFQCQPPERVAADVYNAILLLTTSLSALTPLDLELYIALGETTANDGGGLPVIFIENSAKTPDEREVFAHAEGAFERPQIHWNEIGQTAGLYQPLDANDRAMFLDIGQSFSDFTSGEGISPDFAELANVWNIKSGERTLSLMDGEPSYGVPYPTTLFYRLNSYRTITKDDGGDPPVLTPITANFTTEAAQQWQALYDAGDVPCDLTILTSAYVGQGISAWVDGEDNNRWNPQRLKALGEIEDPPGTFYPQGPKADTDKWDLPIPNIVNVNASLFEHTAEILKAGILETYRAGYRPRLTAAIWTGGQQETGNDVSAGAMLSSIRAVYNRLKAVVGGPFPFIMLRLLGTGTSATTVNAAYEAFAKAEPLAWVFDPRTLPSYDADDSYTWGLYHDGDAGTLTQGVHFGAQAWAEVWDAIYAQTIGNGLNGIVPSTYDGSIMRLTNLVAEEFSTGNAQEVEISSGTIETLNSHVEITVEAGTTTNPDLLATTDDLDTLGSGPEGALRFVRILDNTYDVMLKHDLGATNGMMLPGGTDWIMDTLNDMAVFKRVGQFWRLIAYADLGSGTALTLTVSGGTLTIIGQYTYYKVDAEGLAVDEAGSDDVDDIEGQSTKPGVVYTFRTTSNIHDIVFKDATGNLRVPTGDLTLASTNDIVGICFENNIGRAFTFSNNT